jgi:hypothetical protein
MYFLLGTFHSFPPITQSLDLSHHINGKNAVAMGEVRGGGGGGGNVVGPEEQSAGRLEGCCQMSLCG